MLIESFWQVPRRHIRIITFTPLDVDQYFDAVTVELGFSLPECVTFSFILILEFV